MLKPVASVASTWKEPFTSSAAVAPKATAPVVAAGVTVGSADHKGAILAAIREGNKTLHSMVIAQAQKIELTADSLVFTFAPAHKSLRPQLDGKRAWIESLTQSIVGRKLAVITRDGEAAPSSAPSASDAARDARNAGLKARAKAEPTVQAILDVFGGEIDTVEETD